MAVLRAESAHMVKKSIVLAGTVAVLCGVTWSPSPPGKLVQSQGVAFNGERSGAAWSAVVSKQLVGSGNGQEFYQWHLSIYAMQRGAYRLRYESPKNGGPLSRVAQANGVKMWYPVQDINIVGSAALMHSGARQFIVRTHEMAADCGSATVTLFGTKPGGSIGPILSVENPCDLSAKIAADGASLVLEGPYYGANAPLCCPTKPHATATLRYRNGKWSETPNYFKFR